MVTVGKLFASNLRLFRKHRKLSQEKLAEMAGLSLRGLHDIENCVVWPGSKTITAIASALEIDETLLFSHAYDKPPPTIDEAFEVLRQAFVSLSPSRRRLLTAAASLNESEVGHYAAMMEAHSGGSSGEPRDPPKQAHKPSKQNA